MPSLISSTPSPADPLREDLYLRGGARSLAPLCPALAPVRAFRDEVLERLSAPASQALLLPFALPPPDPALDPDSDDDIGAAGELPLLLLRRASLASLGARLCVVRWPSSAFPRNPAVLSEALALALGTTSAELPALLQRLLVQRPLVLLHPPLVAPFATGKEDDAPLRYYTAWLPELLGRVRAQHPLHALQPLCWVSLSPLRRLLAQALGALWPAPLVSAQRAVAEQEALALMERLMDPLRQRRALPIRTLPVLAVPRLRRADLVWAAGSAAAEGPL